jgi:hypothetical protein
MYAVAFPVASIDSGVVVNYREIYLFIIPMKRGEVL